MEGLLLYTVERRIQKMIQKNKIYCMDGIKGTNSIKKESVDLVFTSPPYYNAREYSQYDSYRHYLGFLESSIRSIHRCLNKDGFFILNTSPVIVPRKSRNKESERLPIPFDSFCIAQDCGFKYVDDIVWEKPDGASSRAVKFSHHRRPMAYKPFTITEYLFVFRRKDAPLIDFGIRKHSENTIQSSLVNDGYERTNVWKINPARPNGHPAPFPVELAEKVIRYYSYIGDLVLDPFIGSGTTAFVSKMLGRDFIGFDTCQEYVELANRRLDGE